jgi:tetratricopeptide (TPR) repeat protein
VSITVVAKRIAHDVLEGRLTLQDVDELVCEAATSYDRPPLNVKSHDGFSDWQIRCDFLGRELSDLAAEAFRLSEQDVDQALSLAQVIRSLSRLLPNSDAVYLGYFLLGYMLWMNRDYSHAADLLRRAAEGYRQYGAKLQELDSFFFHVDALYENQQWDAALHAAEHLEQRAGEHGIASHLAAAVCKKGQVLTSLGRDEALVAMRKAVELRRGLSEKQAGEHVVLSLSGYLNLLGITARKFGRFEEAISAFLEVADLESQADNVSAKAWALSEIGFTYHAMHDPGRGNRYLKDAIRLAESAGDISAATRWRNHLPGIQDVQVIASPLPGTIVQSAEEAYQYGAAAQRLFQEERYEEALRTAEAVLGWAEHAQDRELEVSARSIIAAVYMKRGNFGEYCKQTRSAIRAADRSSYMSAMLGLRGNLANGLLQQGKNAAAEAVLMDGMARSTVLLAKTEGTEFRQEILASVASLYEQYALLLSHLDRYEQLLNITEQAKARNLGSWIEAEIGLEGLPDNRGQSCIGDLQELRAVEVELEVRHSEGAIDFVSISALQERREVCLEQLSNQFRQLDLGELPWEIPLEYHGSLEAVLAEVLEPGSAALCVFSVREGVCPILVHNQSKTILKSGYFIPWDREERTTLLSQLSADQTGLRDLGEEGHERKSDKWRFLTDFDRRVGKFQHILLDSILTTISEEQIQRLAIIPHRELALFPYSCILNQCDALQSLTVSPSLRVLELCNRRDRGIRGHTILLGDPLGDLRSVESELQFVREIRQDAPTQESKCVADLKEHATDCVLLHAATHGKFFPENPYHSGLAVGGCKDRGIFVQYARRGSLDAISEPSHDAIRLLTVAEIMAEIPLRSCRLAVLSACESGLARKHAGGEFTGLPASLLVAGAKSVIATLWPVHDSATALFMQAGKADRQQVVSSLGSEI